MRGESGFGFVEEKETGATELVLQHGEKRLPVRMRVQGFLGIPFPDANLINFRRQIEQRFRAKEKSLSGAYRAKRQTKRLAKRIGIVCGEVGVKGEIAIAALE